MLFPIQATSNGNKIFLARTVSGTSCGTRCYIWGEWPSGLRRCDQNRKVPGSNPTRRSAGLKDSTSLQGSR